MAWHVYIHGFNSGKGSRSARKLEEVIGAPVFCPVNDYSKPFTEVMAALAGQISKNRPGKAGERICVLGTSLGGFYALQLRLPALERVIAWNPVIFPALQLASFVGKNIRFTDNREWNFPHEALISYAAAADPRQWDNFYLQRQIREGVLAESDIPPVPPRCVVLGTNDELLDAPLAHAYWKGHARLLEIDSGHHVENFEHVLTLLE